MKKTVKELPSCDRPYEKCEQLGIAALSDTELLAVILRTGDVRHNSVELSAEVLQLNLSEPGLTGLNNLSMHQLQTVSGVGKVKAIQILALCEFSRRMSYATGLQSLSMTSPKSIADCYMEQMRHLKHEEVMILFFDAKHALIKHMIISKGTVNASLTSPREIFIEALRYDAVHFVMLHNHPSGDATPSNQDILVTKRLKSAGEILGITLSDHIIIGNHQYVSLRERGLFS